MTLSPVQEHPANSVGSGNKQAVTWFDILPTAKAGGFSRNFGERRSVSGAGSLSEVRGSTAVGARFSTDRGVDFTYATYELTNLATRKDWSLKVVLVDTAWGVVLCTAVASAGFLIGAWLDSPA